MKMLGYLNKRQTKLSWMGCAPTKTKKAALLIPQYNESSQADFEKRLSYFSELGTKYKDIMDVIIIDDGSTDDSLNRLVKYRDQYPETFLVAAVTPNGNKVGALFMSTMAVSHQLIILSDFDTDLTGIEELIFKADIDLMEDSSLMGFYFRMLPHEGSGLVFLFQQLEYSLQRILYKFHKQERSIRVMPGAGSCYKREVLISIYRQHSGLRNGEDREATLIGLKLGYKTTYQDKVLALTRPPLSFRDLIKQRIRWNLGYLETFLKERKYYASEAMRLSRIGIVTTADAATVLFITTLPYIMLIVGIVSINSLIILSVSLYLLSTIWYLNLLHISLEESEEFKEKRILLALLYTFFKAALNYLAWTGAIYKIAKKKFLK